MMSFVRAERTGTMAEDILASVRSKLIEEDRALLAPPPADLNATYEAPVGVVGALTGATSGAVMGSHIGLALGPLGAMAGTIPGAVVGGIIGYFGGGKIGSQVKKR
jgi:hypothetical protein